MCSAAVCICSWTSAGEACGVGTHAYIMLIAGDRAADDEADGPRPSGSMPPLGDLDE